MKFLLFFLMLTHANTDQTVNHFNDRWNTPMTSLFPPVCGCEGCNYKDGYGWRKDPGIPGKQAHHNGCDTAGPRGTPIYAAADGIVTKMDNSEDPTKVRTISRTLKGKNGKKHKKTSKDIGKGNGNYVFIEHSLPLIDRKGKVTSNKFTTNYLHLLTVLVSPGQVIRKGDLIGYMNSSGKSTGDHLHFEVRVDSKPQDPNQYINMKDFKKSCEAFRQEHGLPTQQSASTPGSVPAAQ